MGYVRKNRRNDRRNDRSKTCDSGIRRKGVRVLLPRSKRDRTAGVLTMRPSPQICTGFAWALVTALTALALGLPVQGQGATSPQPPQAMAVPAQRAVRLELLTTAQRASLPNAAIVTLLSGRTATMGQVRQEHDMRMQRFANARVWGSASQKIPVRQNPANQGSNKSPLQMPPVQYAAKDYTDFCIAAQATACLYFPAGVSSYIANPLGGWGAPTLPLVFDIDPLITEGAVCSAGGGNLLQNNAGCAYAYPVLVTPNFTPGNYTASATSGCSNGMFSETYDPHGAVQITYINGPPIVTTTTTQPGLVCIVRVVPN
jgi:hypothetical protein